MNEKSTRTCVCVQSQQRVVLNAPGAGQPPPQQLSSMPSSYAAPVGAQSSSFIPHTMKMPGTMAPPSAAAAPAAAAAPTQAFFSPSPGSIPLGLLLSWKFRKSWVSWVRFTTSHQTHYRSYCRLVLYRSNDPTNSVIALREDRVLSA